MKKRLLMACMSLAATFANASEVSVPTIVYPANKQFDVAPEAQFQLNPATTFETGSPGVTTAATTISTELLLSNELLFVGGILGGATGYDNFSTVGLTQYQVVEAHEDSKILIDGKRVVKWRVYHAPMVEALDADGNVVSTMKGLPTALENITHKQDIAVIDKTIYTNGAKFAWHMKSSSLSDVDWEGSVSIQMLDEVIIVAISQEKETDKQKAFHNIKGGELGCEMVLGGVKRSLYEDIPQLIIADEDNLGFNPQVSCHVTESNKAGAIVRKSYFTNSPRPLAMDKLQTYSFSGGSSALPQGFLEYPDRYALAARQKAQLPSGKIVTSNWTEGTAFTTSTELKLKVTQAQDIRKLDFEENESKSIQFIVENVGQVNAAGGIISTHLNRYNYPPESDFSTEEEKEYARSIFSISSDDPNVEISTSSFYNHGQAYKSGVIKDLAPGATATITVTMKQDEHQKGYMRVLNVKGCDSLYCSQVEPYSVALCYQGNCPQINTGSSNSSGGSDSSGGGSAYALIILAGLLGLALRRSVKC